MDAVYEETEGARKRKFISNKFVNTHGSKIQENDKEHFREFLLTTLVRFPTGCRQNLINTHYKFIGAFCRTGFMGVGRGRAPPPPPASQRMSLTTAFITQLIKLFDRRTAEAEVTDLVNSCFHT